MDTAWAPGPTQRFLQVVRDDIGKLLEVLVRPGDLVQGALALPVSALAL